MKIQQMIRANQIGDEIQNITFQIERADQGLKNVFGMDEAIPTVQFILDRCALDCSKALIAYKKLLEDEFDAL